MRTISSKLAVVALAIATAAAGSWLLLAEPSLGRTRDGRPRGAARAKAKVRPRTHGYGGYSGVCTPGSFTPLSAPQAFIRRGKLRCFATTGNPTGDNPDLSTDVFLATEAGLVTNMTKDTRRCVEGPNNGMTCAGYGSCPEGRCEDNSVVACTADAHGAAIFFIFDGNPTGQNPDLGDELFVFENASRKLTQLTVQAGWCNDNPSIACSRSSECPSGFCARARMTGVQRGYGAPTTTSGLEVSPDGDLVWFLTDGDPGDNPAHEVTQFVLGRRGRFKGFRRAGSAGKFCSERTKHPGMACSAPIDCGSICGDARKDPDEQCEPFITPSGCPEGQFCQFPRRSGECTCIVPTCGNLIIEPGEVCDGPFGCPFFQRCTRSCNTCVNASPSGAFVDPAG